MTWRVQVKNPGGKTVNLHPEVAAQLESGTRAWYRCFHCGGVDRECEYCGGDGYVTLLGSEASYPWIFDALSHPSRVRRKAIVKIIRRAIAKPLRRLANKIYWDEEES